MAEQDNTTRSKPATDGACLRNKAAKSEGFGGCRPMLSGVSDDR